MDTKLTFHPHPSEEMLEEYAFNRLPESATEAVEEHLLICPDCQADLQVVDEYILLMKAATADYQSTVVPAWATLWERIRAAFGRPRFVSNTIWAAGVAILCLMVVVSRRNEPVAPVPVALVAFRGGEEATTIQAPAERALDLAIDVADLPPANVYRMEIVDSTGQPAWKGEAQRSNGKLIARVRTGLKAGVYWTRLYAGGELLREFGVRIG